MTKQLDLLILDSLRYKIDKNIENFLLNIENPLKNKTYFELSNRITNIPNFSYYFQNSELNAITIFTDFESLNKKIFNNIDDQKYYFINIIDYLKPKIIFLRDYSVITQAQLDEIKKLNFKKKIFTSIGFPLPNKHYYKYFDKIYFRNPNVIERQGHYAKEHTLIYHSFNEKILEKINLKNFEERNFEISFCGGVQSNTSMHHYRRYQTIFKLLKNKIDINLFLNENNSFDHYMRFFNYVSYKILKKKYFILYKVLDIFGKLIKKMFNKKYKIFFKISKDQKLIDNRNSVLYKGPLKFFFPFKIKKGKFGKDYYSIINESKISLNIHNDTDYKQFGYNIRNFEITGFKSCLLVENGKKLNEIFEKDKDLITYDNYEDLIEKIDFLKKNSEIARSIALNGYNKTLKYHTHKIRSEEFKKDFLKYI